MEMRLAGSQRRGFPLHCRFQVAEPCTFKCNCSHIQRRTALDVQAKGSVGAPAGAHACPPRVSCVRAGSASCWTISPSGVTLPWVTEMGMTLSLRAGPLSSDQNIGGGNCTQPGGSSAEGVRLYMQMRVQAAAFLCCVHILYACAHAWTRLCLCMCTYPRVCLQVWVNAQARPL